MYGVPVSLQGLGVVGYSEKNGSVEVAFYFSPDSFVAEIFILFKPLNNC